MGRTSAAVKNKYNKKAYDQLNIFVKKGEKEVVKAQAESRGLSLNGYINQIIAEDMAKEQTKN